MATLKRLRTVLLAAAACLPWNRLHAQESNSLSPSPDSRTLVRDIQNPVDYHTGTVNVQAPLYTVQANGISIPITLSYNTSGIKVNDTPTSTGLGWRLSAGGKITRIVKKISRRAVAPNSRHLYKKRFDPTLSLQLRLAGLSLQDGQYAE